MSSYDYFELQRQSDDLVYQFDRRQLSNGAFAYQRRDQDLWVIYKPELGWVAFDEVTQSLTGRAWDMLPNEQNSDHPPEGIWVSRKNEKSYVYKLKYLAK